nr:3-hydroxyacyl-CoA dehydrogenase NAD-binding domain-containing protein [Sphingomonas sp. Y57]
MIGIIGGGTMGLGIAVALAGAGHDITLFEPNSDVRASVDGRLDAIAAEGFRVVRDRLKVSDDLAAMKSAMFIIEAVPENLDLKRSLYGDLFAILPADTIIASNTSTLPPDLLAEKLPDDLARRLLVAHFWNPPYFLPLVEVLSGSRTDPAALATTVSLLADAGLKPVVLDRAVPGFIGNRLQLALVREALHLLESGVATADVIDEVVRSSIGRRWSVTGPFESADLGGIHIFATVSSLLFPVLANQQEGAALLADMAARGDTGARVGRGFYEWTSSLRDEVARRRSLLMGGNE